MTAIACFHMSGLCGQDDRRQDGLRGASSKQAMRPRGPVGPAECLASEIDRSHQLPLASSGIGRRDMFRRLIRSDGFGHGIAHHARAVKVLTGRPHLPGDAGDWPGPRRRAWAPCARSVGAATAKRSVRAWQGSEETRVRGRFGVPKTFGGWVETDFAAQSIVGPIAPTRTRSTPAGTPTSTADSPLC